jgi:hypothetical protein
MYVITGAGVADPIEVLTMLPRCSSEEMSARR